MSQEQPRFAGDREHLDRLLQALGGEEELAVWNAWRPSQGRLDLRGVRLLEVALPGIDLRDCDLLGAAFLRCDLQGTRWTGSRLLMLDLAESDCRGADFSGCALTGSHCADCDFSRAVLDDCDFGEAQLKRARLDGTSLAGTQLIWCRGVSASELAKAHGDARTSIPEAMPRPAWGGAP